MGRIASCCGVLLVLLFHRALAQRPADSGFVQDSAPRVFFDCPGYAPGCDFDFLRTEITWVNWVRDREAADVHALISTQRTGGGGTEYTLSLIGLRRFAGKSDTLRYYSTGTSTADETRRGLARRLELALASYVATTPLAAHLTLTYESPTASGPAAAHDPWDAWVFTLNGGGFLQGQQSNHSTQLNVSFGANRTTPQWKHDFSVSENYNQDVFNDVPVFDTLGNQVGTETVHSISRSYGGNLLVVKSLGPNWSVGTTGNVNHSTFGNIELGLSLGLALEYDIFPYDQSTRREFTLQYSIAPQYSRYIDTTIFGKTHETLGRQSLGAALSVTQPWGSASVSLTASEYLQDVKQNHVVLFGSINLRLFKGLSLNVSGDVARIHDQRALSEVGATPDEILLRRRELATSYSYFTFIGITYRFGSTLNNTVNPRFPSAGGFTISF
ncbi:MAG TPA: hypothetical protein VKB45_05185 [Gemmatimonadales bacterium]|nr:hypothetical protein [Gemmatimonadales bacterium]